MSLVCLDKDRVKNKKSPGNNRIFHDSTGVAWMAESMYSAASCSLSSTPMSFTKFFSCRDNWLAENRIKTASITLANAFNSIPPGSKEYS